jgi:hypothetical protein
MDEKRIPKRVLKSNITGKRPVGKQRKRWVNAVEIDSRVILKLRNWRGESLDRQIWRRHLKEAKARLRTVVPQKKIKKKRKRKRKDCVQLIPLRKSILYDPRFSRQSL